MYEEGRTVTNCVLTVGHHEGTDIRLTAYSRRYEEGKRGAASSMMVNSQTPPEEIRDFLRAEIGLAECKQEALDMLSDLLMTVNDGVMMTLIEELHGQEREAVQKGLDMIAAEKTALVGVNEVPLGFEISTPDEAFLFSPEEEEMARRRYDQMNTHAKFLMRLRFNPETRQLKRELLDTGYEK